MTEKNELWSKSSNQSDGQVGTVYRATRNSTPIQTPGSEGATYLAVRLILVLPVVLSFR